MQNENIEGANGVEHETQRGTREIWEAGNKGRVEFFNYMENGVGAKG